MFFHEYLKILYDYCGGGCSTAVFVREVFCSSVERSDDLDLLPDDSLAHSLFSGKRNISKPLANKVRPRLDRECFYSLVNTAGVDATDHFKAAFGADVTMDIETFYDKLFEQFRLFIDNPGREVANVIGGETKKAPPPCERSTEAQREYDEAVGRYLASARNYYSNVKNLLFSKQSRAFYDFYVCNDISFGNNRKSAVTVSSATAQKLMEIAQFIIITGTGGLGKSMMMMHPEFQNKKRPKAVCSKG